MDVEVSYAHLPNVATPQVLDAARLTDICDELDNAIKATRGEIDSRTFGSIVDCRTAALRALEEIDTPNSLQGFVLMSAAEQLSIDVSNASDDSMYLSSLVRGTILGQYRDRSTEQEIRQQVIQDINLPQDVADHLMRMPSTSWSALHTVAALGSGMCGTDTALFYRTAIAHAASDMERTLISDDGEKLGPAGRAAGFHLLRKTTATLQSLDRLLHTTLRLTSSDRVTADIPISAEHLRATTVICRDFVLQAQQEKPLIADAQRLATVAYNAVADVLPSVTDNRSAPKTFTSVSQDAFDSTFVRYGERWIRGAYLPELDVVMVSPDEVRSATGQTQKRRSPINSVITHEVVHSVCENSEMAAVDRAERCLSEGVADQVSMTIAQQFENATHSTFKHDIPIPSRLEPSREASLIRTVLGNDTGKLNHMASAPSMVDALAEILSVEDRNVLEESIFSWCDHGDSRPISTLL